MAGVHALGYFGIGARDLDAWHHFAADILGLQVTKGQEDGQPVLHLRMDERHHRIAIRPGDDEVNYVGWELASAADLDQLCRDLDAAGVPYKEDAALARTRGVHRLVTCTDPAGINLEFFAGAIVPQEPFVSPVGAEFVTTDPAGRQLGLGHVVFTTDNPDAAMAFYIDVLKFKVSDYIVPIPDMLITFLHVNPRHHSFAITGGHPGAGTRLNHFMVEVNSIDAVGRALDKVDAEGIAKEATLGRHTNDHMLSFYAFTPSGFGVEYGTEGRLIDDSNWTVITYDSSQFWGHRREQPPAPPSTDGDAK
jgi:3,4-dihydroxy-9,10-secoandrosta-1,3,5(10)-triene-9,17-dione 4,5-dioxygenase